jgi:hypothetical protein
MTGVAWGTAVATRCVAGAMMVSDDVPVAMQLCKRRSSLGVIISLAAALLNLTWRDSNITSTSISDLAPTYLNLATQ